MDGHGFRSVGRRRIARSSFLALETIHLHAPDGAGVSRVVVRHPGAVAAVPVVDDHVVLIRQYRSAIDDALLEIPAGKLDVPDEPLEESVQRELQEEIGYTARSLRHLVSIFTTPGFSDEVIHIYLATDLQPVPSAPHGAEEAAAEIVHVPVAEIPALVRSGRVQDAKTQIGLSLLALEHL